MNLTTLLEWTLNWSEVLHTSMPVGETSMAKLRDLTGTKEGVILTNGRRGRPLRRAEVMS